MSFLYSKFTRYHPSGQAVWSLMDSDFGEVEFETAMVSTEHMAEAIARVYIARNLSVGRNLAIAIISWSKMFRVSIRDYTNIHDAYCSKHIPNWQQYAEERDEYINKLLAFA